MGVTPNYRRKGIGRSLMEEYIKESKLKEAHKVSLNTTTTLKPAIRLYIELGFIPEGFLRKHARGTDIIIYSKFLI
jgi:ribosomal protein S18 acetylase RimI-like enzyme